MLPSKSEALGSIQGDKLANHHSTNIPYSSITTPWNIPCHAAHYHILALYVGGFISDREMGGI
jgi:hypothetical protein